MTDPETRFRAALLAACREVFGRYTPEPKIRAIGDKVWPTVQEMVEGESPAPPGGSGRANGGRGASG